MSKPGRGWEYGASDAPRGGRINSLETLRVKLLEALEYELGRDSSGAEIEVPYDELVREPKKPVRQKLDANGDVVVRGSYRFRVASHAHSIMGTIGKVGADDFYKIIRGVIGSQRIRYRDSQRGGNWVLVGFRVVGMQKSVVAREQNPDPGTNYQLESDLPKPQQTVPVPRHEDFLLLKTVWWDAANADETDRWWERTGRTDSPWQAWVQRGVLPPAMQAMREQALDILQSFVGDDIPAEPEPAPAPATPRARKQRIADPELAPLD